VKAVKIYFCYQILCKTPLITICNGFFKALKLKNESVQIVGIAKWDTSQKCCASQRVTFEIKNNY